MRFMNQFPVFLTVIFWFSSLVSAISRAELSNLVSKGSGSFISLTDSNFKQLLDSDRDSYIIALFTATDPAVGCTMCLELRSTFDMVASSWVKDHPDGISHADNDTAIYFAKVDVTKAGNVPRIFDFFNVERVPQLLMFSPDGKIRDFRPVPVPHQAGSVGASQLVEDISTMTRVSTFELHVPIDWASIIVTSVITFIAVLLARKRSSILISILRSRILWGLLSVSFIILMLGGYMFNKMRGNPWVGSGRNGEVIYFIPNEFQNQFAVETQIVDIIYGSMTVLLLALVLGIPQLRKYYKDTRKGDVTVAFAVMGIVALLYVFFSGLTSIFTIKSPGYPFQLMKLSSLFGY